jgi:hypothetical protein
MDKALMVLLAIQMAGCGVVAIWASIMMLMTMVWK